MAGLDVTCAIDNDEKILQSYKDNHKHNAYLHDLSDIQNTVKILNKYNVEIIIGSPPCQEFSSSGLMIEGDRANLTLSFVEIICKIKPKIFILENVARIYVSETFKKACEMLTQSGYSCTSLMLNAKKCGVAQNRQRLFLCGVKGRGAKNACERLQRTVQKEQKTARVTVVKDVIPSIGEIIWFAPRNGFHACVLSTDNSYPCLRSCRGKCMEKPSSKYKRRAEDVDDVSKAHIMSIADAAAISSFPSEYVWPESRVDTGVLLGNCVPPKMAEYVINSVMKAFGDVDFDGDDGDYQYFSHETRNRRQQGSYLALFKQALNIDFENCGVVMGVYDAGKSSGLYEMRYQMGSSQQGDDAVVAMMGWKPKEDWVIVVRERYNKTSKIDDFYIGVPGYETLFRGKRALISLGLL